VAVVVGKRAGAVRTAAYRGLRRLAGQLELDPYVGLPRPRPGRAMPAGQEAVTHRRPAAPERYR
jgi:RNA polymerase sigma-70 factor (ECF subfamily)